MAERHPDLAPSHPGELLREDVFPELGMTKTEFADRLGVSRQTVHDILAERQAVTPEMAVRLGALFGNGPGVWVRMQVAHDLWRATRSLDVSGIKPVRAA